MLLSLTVNGNKRSAEVDKEKPLLWVLREDLKLTGTKFGCGLALCGACTVLIKEGDRFVPKRSCVVRADHADGREIKTIEGIAGRIGDAVQQAWVDLDVPQCGYCQSGQIITTVALLEALDRSGRPLADGDIDAGLAGNLCRCGTYPRIRQAVKVAERLARDAKDKQ